MKTIDNKQHIKNLKQITMRTTFAENFKLENAGKWIWYSVGMGLNAAILNYNFAETKEAAIQAMASHEVVQIEEVEINSGNLYHIMPVEEIDEDSLNEHGSEYWHEIIEDNSSIWQMDLTT